MLIGYARVSTTEQTLDLQRDALKSAGCDRIFTDTASGSTTERKGLDQALSQLRDGDVLVVWRLDRLGRSLRHLIETITALNAKAIGFRSLTEQIDTTTSGGKLIFHIFGALAEFERDIIRERTKAGLRAARARGRKGGRPRLSGTSRKTPINDICRGLNISRATLYRYLKTRPSQFRPCADRPGSTSPQRAEPLLLTALIRRTILRWVHGCTPF